jgi:hypothetical protein
MILLTSTLVKISDERHLTSADFYFQPAPLYFPTKIRYWLRVGWLLVKISYIYRKTPYTLIKVQWSVAQFVQIFKFSIEVQVEQSSHTDHCYTGAKYFNWDCMHILVQHYAAVSQRIWWHFKLIIKARLYASCIL